MFQEIYLTCQRNTKVLTLKSACANQAHSLSHLKHIKTMPESWPTQRVSLKGHQTITAVPHSMATAKKPETKQNLKAPGKTPGACGQALPACLQPNGGKARSSVQGRAAQLPQHTGERGQSSPAEAGGRDAQEAAARAAASLSTPRRRAPGSGKGGGERGQTGGASDPPRSLGTSTKWRPPLAGTLLPPGAKQSPRC